MKANFEIEITKQLDDSFMPSFILIGNYECLNKYSQYTYYGTNDIDNYATSSIICVFKNIKLKSICKHS